MTCSRHIWEFNFPGFLGQSDTRIEGRKVVQEKSSILACVVAMGRWLLIGRMEEAPWGWGGMHVGQLLSLTGDLGEDCWTWALQSPFQTSHQSVFYVLDASWQGVSVSNVGRGTDLEMKWKINWQQRILALRSYVFNLKLLMILSMWYWGDGYICFANYFSWVRYCFKAENKTKGADCLQDFPTKTNKTYTSTQINMVVTQHGNAISAEGLRRADCPK